MLLTRCLKIKNILLSIETAKAGGEKRPFSNKKLIGDNTMPLLKDADQQNLREQFEALKAPVKLIMFTQEMECQYCKNTFKNKFSLNTHKKRLNIV